MSIMAVKFIHILSVVFMSAPFYNLMIVNERALLGKSPFVIDKYMERLLKGAVLRCFVYQFTALVTGILLITTAGMPLATMFEKKVLLLKLILLLTLTSLLSVVHFYIHGGIERLLEGVEGTEMPEDVAKGILPLRKLRKKIATVCLLLVITIILLGVQAAAGYNPWLSAIFIPLAALFALRSFGSTMRFGWF